MHEALSLSTRWRVLLVHEPLSYVSIRQRMHTYADVCMRVLLVHEALSYISIRQRMHILYLVVQKYKY